MQLLIGTKNPGKIIEISEVLSDLPCEIMSPQDRGIEDDPEETGDTFEENALQKAHFYYSLSKTPTVADDSGIIVEALQHELGIHTRRWGAGADASDEEWIIYFLNRMSTEENKHARFICVIAYIDNAGNEHLFEGTCDGIITDTLQADYLPGLPISGCFKPDGCDVVYSAMTVEQKNAISHRGRAVLKLKEYLTQKISPVA